MFYRRGQLSLEYLLLLLAGFAAFAVLLPAVHSAYQLSLLGLDTANARHFAGSVQQHADSMLFQGEGGSAVVTARPFTEWVVYSSGSKMLIEVRSSEAGEGKQISVELPNAIFLPERTIAGETRFAVRKHKGEILVEYL